VGKAYKIQWGCLKCFQFLFVKHEGKRSPETSMFKWDDNIKVDFKEIVDCIHLYNSKGSHLLSVTFSIAPYLTLSVFKF
jgi:hypothetical protein